MEQAWRRYERFDAGEAPRSMATDPAGVEALLSAQPETVYWDRLFREKFDGARLFVCDSTSAVPKSVRDQTDPLGAPDLGCVS